MTREKVLSVLRDQKPYLVKNLGVRSIGLFGSLARNEASDTSDVDILVELEKPDFALLMAIKILLENQLGSTVDLLRKGPHLDPRFLETIESEMVYA